ncbi:LysR family transcriptional regulator [uncultured Roseovarius sp.]|uniref:LysR family transcriptional regulator n=1 Tax=uncultured Roseovarius sp. TaxID=293344 RepID=UPI002602130B|nr:LysR family transcriptional regulator [uncultured Roseovarius sp.]
MNFTQIKTFRAVMTSTSLSAAAQKLGRTQPAVSLAIRSLEETLGLKLFERKGRQLVPVPEAQYLLLEVEEILGRLSTVSRTMKSLAEGQSGTLNVSAMPGGIFLFSRFIGQAIEPNSDVELAISARSSLQILELVSSQSIDFGFGDAPIKTHESAQFTIDAISGECFCVVPRGHRLAKADIIGIKELDREPIGVLQSNHAHHRKTLAAFEKSGASYRKFIESQTFLPLLQFVRSGHCVAIVDPLTVVTESIMNSGLDDIVFKPLKEEIRYDYAILTPSHRPLSQLAISVRSAWIEEVIQFLVEIGANPKHEQAL